MPAAIGIPPSARRPGGPATLPADQLQAGESDLRTAGELIDKTKSFFLDLIQIASGHEQIIIGAGYVGFLTIWAQTAPHLGHRTVLLSGGLIGVSLFTFIAFHILQIAIRSVGAMRMGLELKKESEPLAQLQAMAAAQQKAARDVAIILIIWPAVFAISVGTGLASAALTIGSAFWAVVESSQHAAVSQPAKR